MVVHIVSDVVANRIPGTLFVPIVVAIASIFALKAWVSGKKTNRERDLHGRTILLTGASNSLGLTLISELAQRGAQVIAVVPDLSDPTVLSLVDVIRHTTKNELIYAEACDLSSANSIKDFCAKFVKSTGGGLESEPPRLDAIIFAHEYPHIGAIRGTGEEQEKERLLRLQARLASFFFVTLLLPVLLTAPQDRDIRFISIVPPFYGAAIPSFDPTAQSQPHDKSPSIWVEEGRRSLLSILFTRHLQRILDALPSTSVQTRTSSAQGSSTGSQTATEAVAAKRPSNIMAVAVSPGISRSDTVAPFMRADRSLHSFSALGLLFYTLLYPLLFCFTKSSEAAVQSVLHALFLPSRIKMSEPPDSKDPDTSQGRIRRAPEHLLGGSLYAECEKVHLPGNAEKKFGDEDVGTVIWGNLEHELAGWRKSEETKS